jgi:hypothetical protein
MGSRARTTLFLAAFLQCRPGFPAGETDQFHAGDFQGPAACGRCHPQHYQEWRGSAHAYSTVDPLVQACNRLAQEETGGKIGSFCVNCHVPLGTRTGEVRDSLLGRQLSPLTQTGVSCEVCHKMKPPQDGKPVANASFEMDSGNVFFGPLANPQSAPSHPSAASEYLGESGFCGSCHDVLHNSALLEKTFAQWASSPYYQRVEKCQDCHMVRYSGQAAVGGPQRETLRRHNFPAVSIPLVPFPNRGYQTEQVQELLRTAVRMAVLLPPAVQAGGELAIQVKVKNSGAGHNVPTGLSNERQMWLETTVLDGGGTVLFSSGSLDERGDLPDGRSGSGVAADPTLVSFSDRFLDERGKEVGFVWQASKVEERSLKPLEERSSAYRIPIAPGLAGSKLRVKVRLLFRPFAPYGLRALGLAELAKELPIWEAAGFESEEIAVLHELPRRRAHLVPGDFPDIASAVEAARDGETVLVLPGEYRLLRSIDFGGKSLRLRSRAGAVRTTLLWAGGEGPQASVVVFRSGEGPEAVLEGFTITGGRGTEVGGARKGGGIYISRSSPTISRNRIVENEAGFGEGGGIFCEAGHPVLTENRVRSCRAKAGAGVALVSAADSPAPVVFSRCSVEGNISKEAGGGLLLLGGEVRLLGCVVAGNTAGTQGGGLSLSSGTSLILDHSTLAQNRAREGGALFSSPGGLVRISSSILWDNLPPGCRSPGSIPEVSYSILDSKDDLSPTNRSEFPLFVDPQGFWDRKPGSSRDGAGEAGPAADGGRDAARYWVEGDYHLLPGSPAIDAGDPRLAADPDDSRNDIGAFFFEQPLKAFIRGDVDGDGKVEIRDLQVLLSALSGSGGLPCLDAADIDDDGVVDRPDAVLLAGYLFAGGPPPEPPFGGCGLDPTFGEGLSCEKKAAPCRE